VTTNGFTVGLHDSWSAFAKLFVRYPRPFARMKLTADETAIIIQMLSHKPGHRVNIAFLRENIEGLSRDKCYAAIKRLDERGILNRRRLQDGDGKFTGMHYELLPPPEYLVIAKALADADDDDHGPTDTTPLPGIQEMDEPRISPPLPEPQEMDPTSENTPETKQNPRSEPLPDQPYTAEPYTAGATQRESIKKEEKKQKEDLSLQAPTPAPAPPAEPRESIEPENNTAHGGHVLAAQRILRDTVPAPVAAKLSDSQRNHVVSLVADLLATGWAGAHLRARLDGKVTAAAHTPYVILRDYLQGMAAETPQESQQGHGDPWGTNTASPGVHDDDEAAPGVRLLANGERQIRYSSCGARDCTGGSGAGRGIGTYRRRIDPETGSADERCSNPVTLSDGRITTCHPDARRDIPTS
jgi:hypothetical protein